MRNEQGSFLEKALRKSHSVKDKAGHGGRFSAFSRFSMFRSKSSNQLEPSSTHASRPASPLMADNNPSISDGGDQKPTRGRLRRVTSTYDDLRGWARRHSTSLTRTSPSKAHLLPSPDIESCEASGEPRSFDEGPFDYSSLRGLDFVENDQIRDACTYGVIEIELSERALHDHQDLVSQGIGLSLPSTEVSLDDNHSSLSSSTMPRTPSDISDQPRLSSESGWAPNISSHGQEAFLLRERYLGDEDHSTQDPVHGRVAEHEIMNATVLVGPGKPRIVHIKRPSSSLTSMQSNPSPSRPVLPSTPVRSRKRSISPGPDGSFETTPFTDLSPIEHDSSSLLHTDPSVRPLQINSTSDTLQGSRHDSFAIRQHFSLHNARGKGDRSCRHLSPARQDSRSLLLSAQSSPERFRNYGPWNLGQSLQTSRSSKRTSKVARPVHIDALLTIVTTAVDLFPTDIKKLDARVIWSLLSPSTDRDAEIASFVSSLAEIFPCGSQLLLSALAAWLLIDLCFMSVSESLSRRVHGQRTKIAKLTATRLNRRSLRAKPVRHDITSPLSSHSIVSLSSFPAVPQRPEMYVVPRRDGDTPSQWQDPMDLCSMDMGMDNRRKEFTSVPVSTPSRLPPTRPRLAQHITRPQSLVPRKACHVLGIDVDTNTVTGVSTSLNERRYAGTDVGTDPRNSTSQSTCQRHTRYGGSTNANTDATACIDASKYYNRIRRTQMSVRTIGQKLIDALKGTTEIVDGQPCDGSRHDNAGRGFDQRCRHDNAGRGFDQRYRHGGTWDEYLWKALLALVPIRDRHGGNDDDGFGFNVSVS